jgi:hypothetical protein
VPAVGFLFLGALQVSNFGLAARTY